MNIDYKESIFKSYPYKIRASIISLLRATLLISVFILLIACSGSTSLLKKSNTEPKTIEQTQFVESTECVADMQELIDPPTISGDKLIESTLVAKEVSKCVNGKSISLQSYLDKSTHKDTRPVGPAYVLNVGDGGGGSQLKLHFKNRLSLEKREFECGHDGADLKLCTNLHTHGLHISPKGNSDNVFLNFKPGDEFDFDFKIPSDHAPGTHWLHAHLHGSTAPQLRNGMSGVIILRGKVDNWLASYGIAGSKEKIFLLQQLEDSAGNIVCGQDENHSDIETSINGQCLPFISASEGEIHRWRLIHAGISATINFTIQTQSGHILSSYEFAKDGINLGRANERKNIRLQPGYRSDILVQMPKIGAVCDSKSSCELLIVDAETADNESLFGKAENRKVIAKIRLIQSSEPAMKLPPLVDEHWRKPYRPIKDEELSSKEQLVAFANEPNGDRTVNGDVYPNGDIFKLKLNEAQTWRLYVGEQQTSDVSHPYHIHVNPFEVIIRDKSSGNIVDRYWKDTVLVSGSNNKGLSNAVEIRSRYTTFDGDFVLHCHNLNHEDAGMMKKVTISK